MAKKKKKRRSASGYQKNPPKLSGLHEVPSLQDLFKQAVALHQAGRLSEAEALYRQILAAEPGHPEALHFLGMLAYQIGKNETAVQLIRMALRGKPDYVEAHNNLGIVLHDQGKLDEAVASFRQALNLKPAYAEVHFNLGNALRDQSKLDKAVDSYRRALSLKPAYAEAHYNLGNALNDQGRLNEVIACYRQALVLNPNYAEVHYNLGNVFKDINKLEEAIASYKRALSLKPDYVDAYNNLGGVLKDQGNLDEAIVSFQKALLLQPDSAEMHYNLGVIYRELGRLEEAVSCYKKALWLKSDYTAAFKDLTTIIQFSEIDGVVAAMADHYNNGDLPDADRIILGFALGKVYEDLRDYTKAFGYLLEANNLKRKSYKYSIHNDQTFINSIKKIFSPDFMASHEGFGYEDGTPIFIVGMPRSGTTLVEQILASHSQVFGAGELAILTNLANTICTGKTATQFPECMLELDMDAFEKMGLEYINKIREYSYDAAYITDKMPYNFLHVGLIRTILPNAKVIHCMRNPMDTCFSIFKNYFKEEHGYAYDMSELGQYYDLYQDLMAYWDNIMPGFIYTLRYEELVSDQQKQTQSLLDYCGLPWDEACVNFHKTERRVSTVSLAQVRQPIYKDSVELWKCYEKQLEPLRKAIYG